MFIEWDERLYQLVNLIWSGCFKGEAVFWCRLYGSCKSDYFRMVVVKLGMWKFLPNECAGCMDYKPAVGFFFRQVWKLVWYFVVVWYRVDFSKPLEKRTRTKRSLRFSNHTKIDLFEKYGADIGQDKGRQMEKFPGRGGLKYIWSSGEDAWVIARMFKRYRV